MIRIVICDDHPVVREGLASVLGRRPNLKIVGAVGSVEELIDLAPKVRADVVLLDVELPGTGGVAAIDRLARNAPGTRVIMFTVYDADDTIIEALKAGAMGYIQKGAPADEIESAIRDVYAGRTHVGPGMAAKVMAGLGKSATQTALTSRQREVLRLVADGRSNKQIATTLRISERTVKFHVAAIMSKLGVDNRAQAAAAATRKRIL